MASIPSTSVNISTMPELSEKKMIGISGKPYAGVRSSKLGQNVSVISTSEDLTTVRRLPKKSLQAFDMYTTEIVAVPIKTSSIPKLPPLSPTFPPETANRKVSEISKLCEDHVFKQADSVQGILNICSELTGIPGCEKYCSQIIKYCNSILAETYQNTSAVIGICRGKPATKFIPKQFKVSKDKPSKVLSKLIAQSLTKPSSLSEEDLENKSIETEGKESETSRMDSEPTLDDSTTRNGDTDWPTSFLDDSGVNSDGMEDDPLGNQDETLDPDWQLNSDSESDWEPNKQKPKNKKSAKTTPKNPQVKIVNKATTDQNNGEFACNLCRQTFKSEDAYVKHQSMHKCDICGIIFFSASSIRDHKRSHSGEKPFICDFCGTAFATNPGLKKHKINMHSDARPFVCDQCPYAGKSRDLLRLHKLIHSTEKKYQCETCGAQFKQYSPFAHHLIVHRNVWPHHCEYCPKKFKTRQRLRIHLETHSDRYKHQCNICGKRMRQIGNLKIHMRTHTGDKPYSCEKCGQRFAHNVTRKKHMETCYG